MEHFQRRPYDKILNEHPLRLEGIDVDALLPSYAQQVINHFYGIELGDDFHILKSSVIIQQNANLINEEDNFSIDWVVFACSGQGDFWLLNKQKDDIGFYDHNQEEYTLSNIISLGITLKNWIILGDLFHQFDLLDEDNPQAFNEDFTLKKEYRIDFIAEVEAISAGLFDRLPFTNL